MAFISTNGEELLTMLIVPYAIKMSKEKRPLEWIR